MSLFCRLTLCAGLALAAPAPGSGQTMSPADSARRALAQSVIALMQRAQFDSAVQRFTPTLRAEIPAARLRGIWGSLVQSLGAVQSVDSGSLTSTDVTIPIRFAPITIEATMGVDLASQITSLALKPSAGRPTPVERRNPDAHPTPAPAADTAPAGAVSNARSNTSVVTATTPSGQVDARQTDRDEERGERAFASGRFQEATDEFERALVLRPGDLRVVERLATLALLRNDPKTASTLLRRPLARDTSARELHLLHAEALRRLRDYSGAAAAMRAAGRGGAADKFASFAGHEPYRMRFGRSSVRVPFVRTDPLPVVSVRVNGRQPAYFLIDTGAGETILDPAFAALVGAQLFGSDTSAFAAGRKAASQHGTIRSLQLGALTVTNLPIRVHSTRPFALAAGGLRVDGIIGTGLFMELLATLDYPGAALELSPRRTASAAPRGASIVPISVAGDHLVLAWGGFGATDSTLMLMDTGLVGATFVAPDTVFRLLGFGADAGTEVTGLGGGGAVTARLVTIPRVRLGAMQRSNVQSMMGVFPPTLEHQFGFPIRGLISHEFLRHYAVTWDFQAMRLVLR